MSSGLWIDFVGPMPSASGKTEQWIVAAKDGGAELGEVRWFGRWRKYAFYPSANCVFEQDCLRAIAEFCERQSRQLRQQWSRRK